MFGYNVRVPRCAHSCASVCTWRARFFVFFVVFIFLSSFLAGNVSGWRFDGHFEFSLFFSLAPNCMALKQWNSQIISRKIQTHRPSLSHRISPILWLILNRENNSPDIYDTYCSVTTLIRNSFQFARNDRKVNKKKNYTEESYSIFILFVQITFVAWRIIRIVLDEKFLNDNNGTKIDLCVRANSTYEYWEFVSKCDRTLNTWSPLFERMYCQRNHLMEITFHRKWPQDRQKLVASSDFQRYAMNASQIDRFHSQIWLRKKIERKKMFV